MADFAHFDCLKADALIEAQLGDTFFIRQASGLHGRDSGIG